MDNVLKNIIVTVEKELFNEFKNSTKNKMERKSYLSVFLKTFLGETHFPMTILYTEEIKKMKNADFNKNCHKIIDTISLHLKERLFFHSIVEKRTNDNYIDMYLETFHEISGLNNCRLGSLILKCLIESKKIVIFANDY